MAEDILASDLSVAIRKVSDGSEYEVGVIYEGAFHVIQRIKAGFVHKHIKQAKAAADQQAPPPQPVA